MTDVDKRMSNPRKPAPLRSPQLPRDEYIEQAHLYKLLRERISEQIPIQELLEQVHFELLATTKLPYAIDYLLTEVKHSGLMAPAMIRMSHYFTPFQAYLIQESEQETGRFTIGTALQVLEADAKYRLEDVRPTGMFFFQFEVLCRNRLNYDKGLWAISNDPLFDDAWAKWILYLRAKWGWSIWPICCSWPAKNIGINCLRRATRSQPRGRSCLARRKVELPLPIEVRTRCTCSPRCSAIWDTRLCRGLSLRIPIVTCCRKSCVVWKGSRPESN